MLITGQIEHKYEKGKAKRGREKEMCIERGIYRTEGKGLKAEGVRKGQEGHILRVTGGEKSKKGRDKKGGDGAKKAGKKEWDRIGD